MLLLKLYTFNARKLLFILSLIFVLNSISLSQNWVKNFGGSLDDKAYAITIDKLGFVCVTGYKTSNGTNSDIYTLKLNQAGTLQWSVTYPGPGNSDDKAYAITIDKQNNVIVAGYSTGIGSHHDFTTIKYNSSGTQQWVARYNATYNLDDEARALITDDSSNVYVTGFVTGIGTDIYTIKYNQFGTYQWGQYYNGTGNGEDKAYAITIDKLQNIYIAGYVYDTVSGFDFATIKYNLNGVQQWARFYNGPGNGDDKAYAITIDKLGFIFVTGYCTDSTGSIDFATLKYDSSGNLLWRSIYDGTGHSDDKAYAITLDSLNNVYVTGSSRSDTSAGSENYVTIKYDNLQGDSIWVARYSPPGAGPDIPYYVHIPKNNSAVFVTGTSWTDSINGMDIATIKYNLLTGDSIQAVRFNGSGNSDDAGYMIASDTIGNIFITGYESVAGQSYNVYVSKYVLGDLITIKNISIAIPDNFKLYQNYPNPFNPETKIKFEIPKSSLINLKIYDVLGREVTTLVNKYMQAGIYDVDFNASKISSGVYFYELTAGEYRDVKKMILVK